MLGGGGRRVWARVSNCFYWESKLKIKKKIYGRGCTGGLGWGWSK